MSLSYLFNILIVLLFATHVMAEEIYKLPDQQLKKGAVSVHEKDYKTARQHVLQAAPSAERTFMLGVISQRLNNWQEAEQYLAAAATTYPLLADYALYFHANLLIKQNKHKEGQAILRKLLRNFPDSPLQRKAALQLAESYYDNKELQSALEAYQNFIERYPSGEDSLRAAYASALCRSQIGTRNQCLADLKKIWLRYPASDYATKAEKELLKLTGSSSVADICSAEELFKRGITLYDLRRYNKSVKTLLAVPQEGQTELFVWRLLLKTGQALTKARRYREAEQILSRLLSRQTSREIKDDALFWLAKVQDKLYRDDEAYVTYMKIADLSPDSPLADDALLEAARIRKYQGKPADMLPLLKRLLNSYARSNLKQQTTWELGWASYLSGDANAANQFKLLTDSDPYREKALYWYSRALANRGDTISSNSAITTLLTNYPLGYYAYMTRKQLSYGTNAPPQVHFSSMIASIPPPSGFERAKALIAFGLFEEARIELLNANRNALRSQKNLLGIARLYLEMEDYASAIIHVKNDHPRKLDKETMAVWAISYPTPYVDLVSKYAVQHGIPLDLVFSIIRAESNFSRTAHSPAGAIGLMQLMPSTAALVSKRGQKEMANLLTTPEHNIRLGVRHLKDLLKTYDGDLVYAIAAYNAGTTNVNRWRRLYGSRKTDEFIESIPFEETREYVKKVLAGAEVYRRLYQPGNIPNMRHAPATQSIEHKTAFLITNLKTREISLSN